MNFFEKYGIEKFSEIERKILNIYLSDDLIFQIEEFGHILMSKKRVSFVQPIFKYLRGGIISKGIDSIHQQFQTPEKRPLINDFCNQKKGFLLCSTHHTFEDSAYICKVLKRLKLVDLKSTYPIFIREPKVGIKFGMAIPILRENEINFVKSELNKQNALPSNFSRVILSLNNKFLNCARCLIEENKIIVLFPEGIRRDVATKERINISLHSKTILKYFQNVICYGVRIMDDLEVFGTQKNYKSGNRVFELQRFNVDSSIGNELSNFFQIDKQH